jgi:uncharacterized protein with HEPN domain
MSKDKLRVPDYIEHILAAIERIRRYTQGMTEPAFLANEQVQDAVLRNIEIIPGNTARSPERQGYPDTPRQYRGWRGTLP